MTLTREELEVVRKALGREPTPEELAMFEAQWSEHCSYKSSRRLLKLLPTEKDYVILGPGRDAPAVEVFPGVAVVFKIESHNHPSAVEPYNGAATGIGGVVRDVLALGARPVALLDLLYLGDPRDTHANRLIKGIVRGVSDYGNGIGVPTVAGDAWFDPAFSKQPLVNVACVGVANARRLLLGRPKAGDLIVVVGSPTGRDGVLGSSFASKPLSEEAAREARAVPEAYPEVGRRIIEAVQELVSRSLVEYVKDLGAGGLATAVVEAAADHELGATVYLEKLHVREELTPLEMLVSETQERMMLVVDSERLSEVAEVLSKHGLEYSVVGRFDASGRLRVYYAGRLVADVPAKLLARAPAARREARPPLDALKGLTPVPELPEVGLAEAVIKVISSPNVASKRWIYEHFDYEAGARTVVKPGWGDAAVLRLLDGGKGIAVKGDANPRYTLLDPFGGAANSVAECFRNLVSVNSTPLAIVDQLNAGNPEKPEHFWYFEQMVKGVAWMAGELGLPVVGGKISLYNEDERGRQIKPTAAIVGVGRVDDVAKVTTMPLKEGGNYLAVVGVTYPELGGSEYLYRVHGLEVGEIPKPRPASELRHAEFVKRLADEGIAVSVHDISTGGLAAAVIEMAVTSCLGVELHLDKVPARGVERLDELLFSETQARYLVEVRAGRASEFKELARRYGVECSIVGTVQGREAVVMIAKGRVVASFSLHDLADLYNHGLEKLVR